MNSFSLLSFVSPYWLIGIPLITGLLIYIYRQKGSNQKIVFGSLFLIKQLNQAASARKKLRLPWRLFFDLLLAILILLIIAGPYLKNTQEHVAIIIDNSYSTQALINKNSNRMEDLRSRALEFLSHEKANLKVDLWLSTSSEPLALNQNLQSSIKAIESIKSENKVDNFEQQLQTINANPEITKVKIFSDKYVPELASTRLKLKKTQELPNKDYTRSNIAISKLSIDYKNPKQSTLNLKLIYFAAQSERPRDTEVLIEIRKANKVELSRTVNLKAYQSQNESFQLTTAGEYEVELITNEFDAIQADNLRSFEVLNKSKKIAYLGARDLKALNLAALEDYQFVKESIETLSPTEYLLALSDSGTIVNLGLPSIFNLPLSDSLQARTVSIADNPSIVSWNKASPYLRYLDFQESKLSKALIYQDLISDEILIQSDAGAILLSSQSNTAEQLISGIDLLPYQGQADLFKSIMLLNLIKQLELKSEQNQQASATQQLNFVSESESDTYQIQKLEIKQSQAEQENDNIFKAKLAKNDLSENLLKLLLLLLAVEILSRPVFYGLKTYARR